MSTLLRFAPLVIMMAFVYLIIIVPENKRKKKYRGMLDSLKVNDEVMTKGGIIGKIINIQDNFIILQTGPDKIRIKLDKTGVLTLLSELETNNSSEKKADTKKA
ncbi:preprotein translocase subunit YajC [Clostridiaceae bacterium UIB06]|uniref:Preprotein translocase subunit YajC n=1 Tax=Clostridium thailandense TaxID=2794346 RepID=A0A949TMW1_9CLOT|nr:preprotein translocase subunit YajC [Clostridium thailandense]MBV7275310.1 preprotein translocase subunit YajC [Clostridium thailandense]MCH5135826.1 preprotein translocase subunit YajC [Clostridiaceae bacterium UIB06]